VYLNRDKLLILRQFINRTFLGLSDPTKVLLFILITDLFVGFHSAEGWEVILESIATHFGLSENRTLIYLFIATVPVAIDSCTKFWIFTYFTRYSPTSSAIYERMNK
jgi:CemA family